MQPSPRFVPRCPHQTSSFAMKEGHVQDSHKPTTQVLIHGDFESSNWKYSSECSVFLKANFFFKPLLESRICTCITLQECYLYNWFIYSPFTPSMPLYVSFQACFMVSYLLLVKKGEPPLLVVMSAVPAVSVEDCCQACSLCAPRLFSHPCWVEATGI